MIAAEKKQMFVNRLTKVFKHKAKHAQRLQVSCWRVYDHDLPEFPFSIEFYGQRLYVAEYKRKHQMTEEEHEAWQEEALALMSDVLQVPTEKIYIKERKRKANRLDQYQKTGEDQEFFEVKENGLKFWINLTDYLDTGLFLDHRITREWVRDRAKGKDVLNLFAYTGSFSVYAVAGGAKSVTTVDLSKTYLNWGERNFSLNAFATSAPFSFVHADVLQWLFEQKGEQYDLVIMDPPTFSNSKRMKDILDIQEDHVQLINQVMQLLRPGGQLFFSTNYTRFQLQAASIQANQIKEITKATTPFDFEGRLKRYCWLIVK